jgi:hypothetical protein
VVFSRRGLGRRALTDSTAYPGRINLCSSRGGAGAPRVRFAGLSQTGRESAVGSPTAAQRALCLLERRAGRPGRASGAEADRQAENARGRHSPPSTESAARAGRPERHVCIQGLL